MTIVYLALGSNIGDPLYYLNKGLDAIYTIPNSTHISTSSIYQSPPYGNLLKQPNYLNAIVSLQTTLNSDVLLNHIQRIEIENGRIRKKKERWGPRTLDIDIILFGNQIIKTDRLTIPHYDMHNRPFVLVPLLEIAPSMLLPNGRKLYDLISPLDCSIVSLWKE